MKIWPGPVFPAFLCQLPLQQPSRDLAASQGDTLSRIEEPELFAWTALPLPALNFKTQLRSYT